MTLRGSRRPHVVPITAPSFPTAPRTNIYRNIAYSFIAFTVIVALTGSEQAGSKVAALAGSLIKKPSWNSAGVILLSS
jgi:hypothetical protein